MQVRFHRPKPEPKFIINSDNSLFCVTVVRCAAYKLDYAEMVKENKNPGFIFGLDIADAQLTLKVIKNYFDEKADNAFRTSLMIMSRNNDLLSSDNDAIMTKYELFLKRQGLDSAHFRTTQNSNETSGGNLKA